ncbi:hypothetical protein F5B19DRAFT_308850 [Rostrohypoxylon terebratum]|nr:hypothetical protein F5B19DRAFT_308850 [Rostrohypoxylon terebratum]
MRTQILALLVAPVALAATPQARSGLAQTNLLNSLATCETGYVRCENGCMPADAVCCNDNTDEYCHAGYYCVPDACCPDGEICSGWSDDTTTANSFTSTTSHTTTKTRTTTSTADTTSTTGSSQATSTSSTSHTTENSSNDAPTTSAPAITTSVSQQAGGVFTADGRVAAGLAVVAALVV